MPYHGGPLGAHMHDPSATRPGEVDTMIGKWLGALLSRPSHQIRLGRGMNAGWICFLAPRDAPINACLRHRPEPSGAVVAVISATIAVGESRSSGHPERV